MLTDNDNKPLPGVEARLVFGCDPDWQSPVTGYRFSTDESGEHSLNAKVTLDRRMRKVSTNFLDSLFSFRKRTYHLKVGAELEYMGKSWLYVVDICRFPDGYTVMLDEFSIYLPSEGGFYKKLQRVDGFWKPDETGAWAGFEPSNFMLQPNEDDPTRLRWTLKLGFKKARAPIDRRDNGQLG